MKAAEDEALISPEEEKFGDRPPLVWPWWRW